MYTGSFAIASILRLEILLTEKKNVKITNGCWWWAHSLKHRYNKRSDKILKIVKKR